MSEAFHQDIALVLSANWLYTMLELNRASATPLFYAMTVVN